MDFDFDESRDQEKSALISRAFFKLADDPHISRQFPDIARTADHLRNCDTGNPLEDDSEIAFLNLYCAIHGAGSVYSTSERSLLDDKKGYFNHPGGISPLLKAETYINSESVVADLGAGNGLQGLLFQYLYPHQQTLQVELSAEMIQIGMQFQEVLGIPEHKVEWVNDDIMNFSLESMDFLYLYRPSRPMKQGIKLYHNIAEKLHQRIKPLTIFSIADCLKDFLEDRYSLFYTDGHLTCFELNGTPSF